RKGRIPGEGRPAPRPSVHLSSPHRAPSLLPCIARRHVCGLASPSAAVLPLPAAQYDGDEGVRSGVLNAIWAGMIIVGICFAMVHPERGMEHITHAVFRASEQAVAVALGLIGLLAFWSGIMRVAEEAGFPRLIARLLAPLVRRLFPSVPPDHPAM